MNKNSAEKKPLEIANKINLYSFSDIQETALTRPHPIMLEGKDLDTNLYFTKKLIGSTNGINTSGRTLIWANFLQFIEQNLWFGNGSDKLYFKEIDHENKKFKLVHAHNSYLEFLATHGLILSGFFGFILLCLWRRKNSIFIVSILFFSIFQYGIFWGFSLLDLVFTSFLISPINLLTDENQ
jgi:O-antigen ligase